jgi:hypothetical protein
LQSKKFETLGYSRQQAEEMTQYLTEQIILDRLRLSEKFSAKVELEKVSRLPFVLNSWAQRSWADGVFVGVVSSSRVWRAAVTQ